MSRTGFSLCESESMTTSYFCSPKSMNCHLSFSSLNAVHVCEAVTPRTAARANCDGAKAKVASPKENWHG